MLLTLAVLSTEARAEFRIGVWQPGGLTRADISFTSDTVTDLDALGVDLLINTPGVQDMLGNGAQDFEENIMGLWSGTGPQGSRGFVVGGDNSKHFTIQAESDNDGPSDAAMPRVVSKQCRIRFV